MPSLYKPTTRSSVLTKSSTRDSRVSVGGRKEKAGLFSKIKQAFSGNSRNATESESEQSGPSAVSGTSRRRRRRSSVFSSSAHRESKEDEAERELEEKRSRCLAIKVAKRDPLPVQRLLVDCEFCNPPPKFGREVQTVSPRFTSANTQDSLVEMERLKAEGTDLSDEATWNVGLDEWNRVREWWLTPTAYQQPKHHLDSDLTSDKFYTVYDKMVYQTRPLKHPLNLDDILQIVKAGWVGEGTWPDVADDDVWSDTDAEEVRARNKEKEDATAMVTVRKMSPASISTNSSQATMETANLLSSFGSGSRPPSAPQSVANSRLSSRPNSLNGNGQANDLPTVTIDSPHSSTTHVQFSERPHPRALSPASSRTMPPLERVQSHMGPELRPIRSNHSSVISITDSE